MKIISSAVSIAFVFSMTCGIAIFEQATAAGKSSKNNQSQRIKDEDGETFFTSTTKNNGSLPAYRTDKKTGEKIRAFIQAGTPELEQLRLIPSLKGKQREEALKSYERCRTELQPLMAEFNDVRKQMNASLTEKMLSSEVPQMEMNTKQRDFDLLLKGRAMIQNLRSKRLANWEELQKKLTAQQIEELEKLKAGDLPPDLKAE